MKRYKVVLSYDGTNYNGFQGQPDGTGIENIIKKAFVLMTLKDIKIYGASRTDKGVHAYGQVFHFDSDLDITIDMWKKALNKRLPEDIIISNIVEVKSSFHARHSAKGKEYWYFISKSELTIDSYRYMIYLNDLNISLIKQAISKLIGTHDFKNFAKYVENKPTIKTIYDAKVIETKKFYKFVFRGNGFLKYMIRKIMGIQIEIGLERKPLDMISRLLEGEALPIKTAPAKALFLKKVVY